MATTTTTAAASGLQMAATARPCISSSRGAWKTGSAMFQSNYKGVSWAKLSSACHISSSVQLFQRSFTSSSIKFDKAVVKAMSETSENLNVSGLPINLKGLVFQFIFLCIVLLSYLECTID